MTANRTLIFSLTASALVILLGRPVGHWRHKRKIRKLEQVIDWGLLAHSGTAQP